MKPYVKICCIASRDEARLAMSLGATALGLESAMPSGPGPIAAPLIAEIAATVPPPNGTAWTSAAAFAPAANSMP